MTDQIIKNMLRGIDIDTLDMIERKKYNFHRQGLPKIQALYELVKENNDLSEPLQEIQELIEAYEITVKI
ncbi:hypothetical protein AVT43_gp66 [Polaribacter phage P12002L]|uniref:Uncharacterized protein n=2 Tax=Incheonvirus TaxID=2976977 RepID=A0A0F7IJR8_9CAUD|nr:hypothetical protein AVT42_gp68 [Polaribacter phage P12002S]YP_009209726.1 hypothetical protein AVT43_gp66 [Polaribacter phage P12002L]AKG94240.1 hypothetical protein P12002L_0066 [Polaribacter phage P12002L]AKG94324.1 hypothetical protein P12002S_0068 [Polaribacter phage P12002S]